MLPNTMEKVVKIEATPIRQYRVNHCRFPPINKSKVEDWKEYDPEWGDVAYYNFDNKVPLLAYTLNKKLKHPNRGVEKTHIQRRKLIQLQSRRKAEQKAKLEDKEREVIEDLEEVQNISMNPATYKKMKKEFEMREKDFRLNKENMMVRTMFMNDGPDGKGNRLYVFYVPDYASVADLKLFIKHDFGWDITQISVYYQYHEVTNHTGINKIEEFNNEEDVLMVHMKDKRPDTKLPAYFRSKMDDIAMEDVKFFNSSNDPDLMSTVEVESRYKFPDYVDWHSQLVEINQTIWMAKENLKYSLSDKESLDLMVQAESDFYKSSKQFEEAAKVAVMTIVETQATPLNIFNLYGDGGKKYTSAGIFIRHCDEWMVYRKYILNKECWLRMAKHNLKAFSLLRHQYKNLIIPLCWIFEYRGESFEVQSISPLSINSLVYGSNNHGLTYSIKDLYAEEIAQKIADKMNLKQHKFKEILEYNESQKEHDIAVPFTVQIHKGPGREENSNYYIVNPGSLFCWDTILTNDDEYVPKLLVRQLRPEWVINNNDSEHVEGYVKQTWKTPTRCCVWGDYIKEYDYYYFEKRNLDKRRTIITQLYCCNSWYIDINSEINEGVSADDNPLTIAYPWHKFELRELPFNKRGDFWMNETTGMVVTSPPLKKEPLNPDACLNSLGFEASEEDIGEIIKSRRKMIDLVIPNLIEDLDQGNLEVVTPNDLWDMFKTVGINIRHIQKIASTAQQPHVRELAITELVCRKMADVIRQGKNYADIIDTDIFDKISLNLVKQRLSELLEVSVESLLEIDFCAKEPFSTLELPNIRVKSWNWIPESMKSMLKEARRYDEIGLASKDKFIKDTASRERATELFKKASGVWEQIFGDSSLEMAERLLELGI